jgi:stage II sporulation protein D
MLCRRLCTLAILLASATFGNAQQEVSIQVFGLFHAREVVVELDGSDALAARPNNGSPVLLNGEPGRTRIALRAEHGRIRAELPKSTEETPLAGAWTVSARDGGVASFRLSVPGRIARRYQGRLVVRAQGDQVLATVSMDIETAVASVVAAEMQADTPLEALKAQAVVARSFLAVGGPHAGRAFCDTTHCQFLRSPPAARSKAARAAAATHGMVLSFRGHPLAAMYSSRCGGRTRSLQEIGIAVGNGYPYYSVPCAYCLRHPQPWQSHVEGGDLPDADNERARLARARQWGWSALPGSDFIARREGSGWKIEGRAVGHGVGMCQHGAAGMAAEGASFRDILSHYYPNTQVVELR